MNQRIEVVIRNVTVIYKYKSVQSNLRKRVLIAAFAVFAFTVLLALISIAN